MKLIVGLGNPGDAYAGTRHNIGRRIVEAAAFQESAAFSSSRSLGASTASVKWNGIEVLLAYPQTFMNVSGEPVKRLIEKYAVSVETDLLIVMDDAALPFGRLRLRGKGSAGGHNGLKSVEAHLGSEVYSRLRFGIGAEDAGSSPAPLDVFVLERFSASESRQLSGHIENAVKACRIWVSEPLSRAMNDVNGAES